jgi:folate-binding protein YgfZ
VLADGAPPTVLVHSEVPAEYSAALERAALFDVAARDTLEVSGPDAAAFLHRLLANTVRTLAAGEGNQNLLLTSKGKVSFAFDLAVGHERILLSLPPGAAPAMQSALDTYHFSEKVTLRDVSTEHAPLELCGPLANAIVARIAGVEPPDVDHRTVGGSFAGRTLAVARMPVAGSPGVRLDAGPHAVVELWDALRSAGAVPAGRVAYDSLRVEACAAEPGVDADESVYPQEARLERAFALDKGCYIGQEVVAKIDTYGGLNKRLVALRVAHDDPVPRGTRLWRLDDGAWRDLGVTTSWAYSFALDTGMVLAYVKRRHQSVGNEFRLGEPERALGTATIVRAPVRGGALQPTGEFE